MSGYEGLQLDPDGYLDMDAYTNVPDLTDTEVVDLRDALHGDPVDGPTNEEWAELVDGAVGADPLDDGPFLVDDLPLVDEPSVDGDDPSTSAADLDDTDDQSDDAVDADPSDDLAPDGDTTDDLGFDAGAEDWTLDGTEPDLDPVDLDGGGEDLFPDDGGDAALPEVVPDIEDLL